MLNKTQQYKIIKYYMDGEGEIYHILSIEQATTIENTAHNMIHQSIADAINDGICACMNCNLSKDKAYDLVIDIINILSSQIDNSSVQSVLKRVERGMNLHIAIGSAEYIDDSAYMDRIMCIDKSQDASVLYDLGQIVSKSMNKGIAKFMQWGVEYCMQPNMKMTQEESIYYMRDRLKSYLKSIADQLEHTKRRNSETIFDKVNEWLQDLKSWCDDTIDGIKSLGKNEDEENEEDEIDDDEANVDTHDFDVDEYIEQHAEKLNPTTWNEEDDLDGSSDKQVALEDKVYNAIKDGLAIAVAGVVQECVYHGINKGQAVDIAINLVRLISIRSARNIIIYTYTDARRTVFDDDSLRKMIEDTMRIACRDSNEWNATLDICDYINKDTMKSMFKNVFVEMLDSIIQAVDICMHYCILYKEKENKEEVVLYILDRIRFAITRWEQQAK